MAFESFTQLLMMDGHGPYVWSAYAITLVTLIALVVQPLAAKRRQVRELRSFIRRTEEV